MGENELLALAERVEKLEGACREADILIAGATGYEQPGTQNPVSYYLSEFGIEWLVEQTSRHHSIFNQLPSYTASIDAAMTLADAAGDPLDILEEALATAREERDGIYFLPLHICAAALRDRASLTPTTGEGEGKI